MPQPPPPPPGSDAQQPPPPLPTGHEGEALPTNDQEAAAAAQAAVLPPRMPPSHMFGPPGAPPSGWDVDPTMVPPVIRDVRDGSSVAAACATAMDTTRAWAPPPQQFQAGSAHMQSMPAMQDMLRQLMNASAVQGQKYYLVVIPEDAHPRIETFEQIERLQHRIIDLLGQNCSLFPFLGHWLGISRGQWKYLVTPYGSMPLFNIPAPGEIQVDESGWVGEDDQELVIPSVMPEVGTPESHTVVPHPEDNETPMFEAENPRAS